MTSACRILIVDDDTQSLEVLVRVFERDGYQAISATDGRTALDAAQSHSVDIAIVDFNLPDTTGVQVLQQIRRMDSSIPILIMSADERNFIPAGDAGAYSFIPKPVNLSVLRNAVSRALARRENTHRAGPAKEVSSEMHIQQRSVWIRWSRRITWWKSVE